MGAQLKIQIIDFHYGAAAYYFDHNAVIIHQDALFDADFGIYHEPFLLDKNIVEFVQKSSDGVDFLITDLRRLAEPIHEVEDAGK